MTGVPQGRPLKVFEVVSTQVRREGHLQEAAGGLSPGAAARSRLRKTPSLATVPNLACKTPRVTVVKPWSGGQNPGSDHLPTS